MKKNLTPTDQQLADARAHLAANPETARMLQKAGFTVEEFATLGEDARKTLAARRASGL